MPFVNLAAGLYHWTKMVIRQASCMSVGLNRRISRDGNVLERVAIRVVGTLQVVNRAIMALDRRQADSATGLLTWMFSLVDWKLGNNVGEVGIAKREEKGDIEKETILNQRHFFATSPVGHRAYQLLCNVMHAGGLTVTHSGGPDYRLVVTKVYGVRVVQQ
jgi:hypothetical protein